MGNKRKGAHHRGQHATIARRITSVAYGNPATTCRRCGLTLAEHRLTHPADGWDAGHPDEGQTGYAPEHSYCNRSAGATAGNQARRGLNPSRIW